jgi:hypothetical protein
MAISRKIIIIIVLACIIAHAVNRLLSSLFNYLQYGLAIRLRNSPKYNQVGGVMAINASPGTSDHPSITTLSPKQARLKYGAEILTAVIEIIIVTSIVIAVYLFTDIRHLSEKGREVLDATSNDPAAVEAAFIDFH